MQFCHFWPPCKNIVDVPLENLLLPPPWKKSFQDPFLGYMLIYRNAEGVHGKKKFGNPRPMAMGSYIQPL